MAASYREEYSQSAPVPETLKRINMRRFVDALRDKGALTRADLTRITGVSAATSSKVIIELTDLNLIEALDEPALTHGRPGKLFRLARESRYVVGVSVDVHQCHVGTAGIDGKVLVDPVGFKTPSSYEELLSQVEAQVKAQMDGRNGTCAGIGLAVPGIYDGIDGRVVFARFLPFLNGQQVGRDIARRTGIRVTTVQENHGLALYQQFNGKGRDFSHFVVVEIGAGVGASVVVDGNRIFGQSGFTGEIGRFIVNPAEDTGDCPGCLESYASETAILAAVSARLGRAVEADQVDSLSEAEKQVLAEEVNRAVEYLAVGLAGTISLLNPQALFLVGEIFDWSPNSFDLLTSKVKAKTLPAQFVGCRIERATSDKIQGAITAALETVFGEIGPRLR